MKILLVAEASDIDSTATAAIHTAVETAGLTVLEFVVNSAGKEVSKVV